MNFISKSAFSLATASKGNPVVSTATVILFFLIFNIIEASVETVIFGERFTHFLDPIFGVLFISYAAYCVESCAVYNEINEATK